MRKFTESKFPGGGGVQNNYWIDIILDEVNCKTFKSQGFMQCYRLFTVECRYKERTKMNRITIHRTKCSVLVKN